MNHAPNHVTHIPVTVEMPAKEPEVDIERPDLPTPSLWQRAVSVTNKVTGRVAVVWTVDYHTRMFRPYFPDTQQFAPRTHWENFSEWTPAVTFSPAELERQSAVAAFEAELAQLDGPQLGLAKVLCDDADPAKALAKLKAMRAAGLLAAKPDITDDADPPEAA